MNATEHLHPHPPQDLLDAFDRADEHSLIDSPGIQLWVEFDLLCHEYGIDPDIPRHELARIVHRPGGALPASGHSLEGRHTSLRDSRADGRSRPPSRFVLKPPEENAQNEKRRE